MTRKKLDEIQNLFSHSEQRAASAKEHQTKQSESEEVVGTASGSLTDKLRLPKTKQDRIRFTLDLEKTLDDRLNNAASRLNRSKAEITRIALERLLSDLETEWR
jgi:hypothetical protein